MNYRKTHNRIMTMFYMSVFGLITFGLLPWIGLSGETTDSSGNKVFVIQYMGVLEIRELRQGSSVNIPELWTLNLTINAIYVMVWLTFIFSLIALLGLVLIRLDLKKKLGHTLIITGSLAFIFGLGEVLLHISLIIQIPRLNRVFQENIDSFFAYNFLPLAFGMAIFIAGLTLFIQTLSSSLRNINLSSTDTDMTIHDDEDIPEAIVEDKSEKNSIFEMVDEEGDEEDYEEEDDEGEDEMEEEDGYGE